jgi:hypothetical protein
VSLVKVNSWSPKEDMESVLQHMGEELPGGWYDWDKTAAWRYVVNRRKYLKRVEEAKKTVTKRAEAELKRKIRVPVINYVPPDYEIGEEPRYIIRAVYGPLNMLMNSRIVAFPYHPSLLAKRAPSSSEYTSEHILDRYDGDTRQRDGSGSKGWGPREFLHNMFAMVAELHGDCVLYLVHNGAEIRVDADDFAEWVARSQKDPARALIETTTLLEGPP